MLLVLLHSVQDPHHYQDRDQDRDQDQEQSQARDRDRDRDQDLDQDPMHQASQAKSPAAFEASVLSPAVHEDAEAPAEAVDSAASTVYVRAAVRPYAEALSADAPVRAAAAQTSVLAVVGLETMPCAIEVDVRAVP